MRFIKGLIIVVGVSSLLSGLLLVSPKQRLVNAEPASSDIVVEAIPGESLSTKLRNRAQSSWPWYVTRASGLVAGISLILLMLSGIGQITGYTFKILDPLTAWASHRALGIAFTVSVLIHIISILFDHFVPFSLAELLIPWVSQYKEAVIFGYHLGSIYVALGILAFYLTIAITLTSIFWIDKKPKTWRFLHLTSYAVIAMVFVHALFIGTDLARGLLRWIWILINGLVFIGVLTRLNRFRSI